MLFSEYKNDTTAQSMAEPPGTRGGREGEIFPEDHAMNAST